MIHDYWRSDGGDIRNLCIGYYLAMSTVIPGDIAFAKCCYFVRTLCIHQCAVQHLKLPFVAYEELGIER